MIKIFKKIIIYIIPWLNMDKKIYKLYKKSNNMYYSNKRFRAYYYRYKILKKYNCVIAPMCKIGKNLSLPHPMNIVIGADVIIGDNVTIYHDVTIGQNHDKFPKIGNNVTIYAGAKIIGAVKIGDNCIVGANAVVTHDIPDNCVAVGVPAKIIEKK